MAFSPLHLIGVIPSVRLWMLAPGRQLLFQWRLYTIRQLYFTNWYLEESGYSIRGYCNSYFRVEQNFGRFSTYNANFIVYGRLGEWNVSLLERERRATNSVECADN